MTTGRSQPLLAWQRSLYDDNHTTRFSLVVHALTNPLFVGGNLLALSAPFVSAWLALVGLSLSALAIALQGRAHAKERVAPVPFNGALDAVARIVAEQWITFPRFVLDGGFRRAWQRSAAREAS
jgi:hypothetical protein